MAIGDYSIKEETKEYPYSMGAGAIIDSLQTLSKDYKAPVWDTCLLNVSTLIRNNITKEATDAQILSSVFSDMDNIVKSCVSYLTSRPKPTKTPSVIVYLPRYDTLPEKFRRSPSKNLVRCQTIQSLLVKKYIKDISKVDEISVDNVPCFTMCVGFKNYPYVELYKYLQSYYNTSFLSKAAMLLGVKDIRIGLVSNYALDFHLATHLPKLHVLESYTGTIKSPSKFGEKVFKQPGIPFNEVTHLLFGDSSHIKALSTRKDKLALLELAKNKRWYSKSGSEILRDVVSSGMVDPLTAKTLHL